MYMTSLYLAKLKSIQTTSDKRRYNIETDGKQNKQLCF